MVSYILYILFQGTIPIPLRITFLLFPNKITIPCSLTSGPKFLIASTNYFLMYSSYLLPIVIAVYGYVFNIG